MAVTFFQVDFEVANLLIDQHFPSSTYRTWLYLMTLDPFGDRKVSMPTYEELAEKLKYSIASARRAINQLIEFGVIVLSDGKSFQSQIHNLKTGLEKAGKNIRNRFFPSDQKCESKVENDNLESKIANLETNLQTENQNCENQTPEPLLSEDSISLQTIQKDHKIQTFQIAENPNQENQEDQKSSFSKAEIKSATTQLKISEKDNQEKVLAKSETESKPKIQVKPKVVASGNNFSGGSKPQKNQIPEELAEKLRELEIPLSSRVRTAIKNHHISQAYGAAAHVENTWQTIKDPESVFLFQLPKQRIEKLGSRHSEKIIADIKAENQRIEEEMKDPEVKCKTNDYMQRIKQMLQKKKR